MTVTDLEDKVEKKQVRWLGSVAGLPPHRLPLLQDK